MSSHILSPLTGQKNKKINKERREYECMFVHTYQTVIQFKTFEVVKIKFNELMKIYEATSRKILSEMMFYIFWPRISWVCYFS